MWRDPKGRRRKAVTERKASAAQGARAISRFLAGCAALAAALALATPGRAERIKDVAAFEGVREHRLVGYGLVVGLDGSGDKGLATQRSIANMLQRMGLAVAPADVKAKNSAAVMVTATLPPFPRPGMRLDALVSALGDAKTLQGGTLLLTPLSGPDGLVYATCQGPISVGGFVGGDGGARVQKNHPTVGRVPGGAVVEREIPFSFGGADEIRLFLRRQDFTTAARIAASIDAAVGAGTAVAVDAATVRLRVPPAWRGRLPEFLASVEKLEVDLDAPARVTVNERTGTVVIGDRVRIAPVAIAHGALTIEVKTELRVSQPPPFAPEQAQTVVVPERKVAATEQKAALAEVSGATLGEIVRALNALGVTPRDLIGILQALHAAGALRAELEVI